MVGAKKTSFVKQMLKTGLLSRLYLKKTLATPQLEDKQSNFKVDKLSEEILHKRRYKHNQ